MIARRFNKGSHCAHKMGQYQEPLVLRGWCEAGLSADGWIGAAHLAMTDDGLAADRRRSSLLIWRLASISTQSGTVGDAPIAMCHPMRRRVHHVQSFKNSCSR